MAPIDDLGLPERTLHIVQEDKKKEEEEAWMQVKSCRKFNSPQTMVRFSNLKELHWIQSAPECLLEHQPTTKAPTAKEGYQ